MVKIKTKIISVLLAFGLIFTPIGANSAPIALGSQQFSLSPYKEKVLGDVILQRLYASGAVFNDELTTNYLRKLGKKLAFNANKNTQGYNFFAVYSDQINAFAFFGGNIGVNLGTINAAESEGELAAVIAHEIAHIQQNHLARQIENAQRVMPISILEAIAAIAIGAPNLAIAAMASMQQSMINYTREFEKEADRVGIMTLAKSGFDPQDMANIFYRMQRKSRYSEKPPEYLITHPLYENRIADSRARAGAFTYRQHVSSQDFKYIKARADVATAEDLEKKVESIAARLNDLNHADKKIASYKLALVHLEQNKPETALNILAKLNKNKSEDLYIQLLLAETYNSLHNYQAGLDVLQNLYKIYSDNSAVILALAESYLAVDRAGAANKLLAKYIKNNDSLVGLELMAKTQSKLKKKPMVHFYKAKWHLLRGEISKAYAQLDIAKEFIKQDIATEREIENLKLEIDRVVKEQSNA